MFELLHQIPEDSGERQFAFGEKSTNLLIAIILASLAKHSNWLMFYLPR
jgi:hypothetical protein